MKPSIRKTLLGTAFALLGMGSMTTAVAEGDYLMATASTGGTYHDVALHKAVHIRTALLHHPTVLST